MFQHLWFDKPGYPKLLESAKFSVIAEKNIKINRCEVLGRGSYGIVYAAVYDGAACVVVKEMHPYLIKRRQNRQTPVQLVFEEINILSSLRHPNIVQFLGVHFLQENFAIDLPIPILVMERMWKSLWAVLEDHHEQLSLVNKAHILHDVACGLQYLHNKEIQIIHRDLNSNNILLNESLIAKIGDVGQARALELVNDKELRLSTAPGNTLHMPPEALVHKPVYDSSLDIFLFGCVVIHTATEKLPIPTDQYVQSGNSNMFVKQTEIQRRQQYLDLMNDHSVLQKITIQCLADTPKSRPSASHICDMLLEYIQRLEVELPVLTEQHKQDKLSLIHFTQETKKEVECKYEKIINEKDECISTLELQLHDSRSKLKQNVKETSEKMDLEMKLSKQVEMVNSELMKIKQEQVDKLKEGLKASSDTCIQIDQQINDLQERLKYENSSHLNKTENSKCRQQSKETTSTFITKVRKCCMKMIVCMHVCILLQNNYKITK